jgi:GTPase SAR1 family protein
MGNKIKSFTLGRDTRIPTDGIDMKKWQPTEMENTLIYFWDFAGQELYYATHHFFLSENSINFIVFDCTKSLEENRLLFWLNSIQSMASGSIVMLIGSFTDKLNDKKKIQDISDEINKLIELWQSPIPSPLRPKFYRYQSNGQVMSFWPLNCIGSSKEIDSFYRRYHSILICH